MDSSIVIDNVKHTKIATIFGEGTQGTQGTLDGEINYLIFTYPYVIKEKIDILTDYTDNPLLSFHSVLSSSILNKEGQALVKEMDAIVGTYKMIN